MPDEPSPRPMTYIARPNLGAYERLHRRKNSFLSAPFIRVQLITSVHVALMGVLGCVVAQTVGNQPLTLSEVLAAGIAVFVVQALAMYAHQSRAIQRGVARFAEQKLSWFCEISDEGFQSRSNSGVVSLVPWSLMKLQLEDPDAWWIEYEQTGLVIFREPLRVAGLEDEFRRRIGH